MKLLLYILNSFSSSNNPNIWWIAKVRCSWVKKITFDEIPWQKKNQVSLYSKPNKVCFKMLKALQDNPINTWQMKIKDRSSDIFWWNKFDKVWWILFEIHNLTQFCGAWKFYSKNIYLVFEKLQEKAWHIFYML